MKCGCAMLEYIAETNNDRERDGYDWSRLHFRLARNRSIKLELASSTDSMDDCIGTGNFAPCTELHLFSAKLH